jgi:hypothetical protein
MEKYSEHIAILQAKCDIYTALLTMIETAKNIEDVKKFIVDESEPVLTEIIELNKNKKHHG